MTALDVLVPNPRLLELDQVDVAAPPERVWAALRHGELTRSRIARALFALRTLPDRLAGRGGGPNSLRLDDLRSTPERPGFQILAESPPQEVAVGAIGKVWRLDIPFVHLADAAAYAAFAEPGFVKVAWALRILARGEAASRVELEVRVLPTDEASWAQFSRYFRVIGPASRYIRRTALRRFARQLGAVDRDGILSDANGPSSKEAWRDVAAGVGGAARIGLGFLTPFLRRKRQHWGVDPSIAARAYPGDTLVPAPSWSWTHGVEIEAPADEVWGWVAQLGADRGGFYSYQWLENVFGCQIRNAERVHPEWEVRQGGELWLHPKRSPLAVVEVVPGRYFVAYAAPDPAAGAGKPWIAASWLFWIEPLGPGRCRLVSRYRAASSDDVATRVAFGPALLEPVGFAMDREMLLGIKARAERAARGRAEQLHSFGAAG